MKQSTEQAISILVHELEPKTLNDMGILLLFNKPAELKFANSLIEIGDEYLESARDGFKKQLEKRDMSDESRAIIEEMLARVESRLESNKNE
ncbi:hypothetical protein [Liquorilactobacillus mali]|uniref:Uncharacterized protein n=1 Tax=Liquorilactobacillus mali KCTC 3596 = DSM 20444 TaxID=1046596 RepID=A0A0R2EBH8_9LACO|nr:hypothetical protein [Liquorilactobacillus mali]KRN09405.1 hypothetical protein FD00_GL001128 [Liquorilactobacillus mali KCTC 3596 = DSM 20444]